MTLALRGRTLTIKVSGAFTKASVTIKRGSRTVARGSGKLKRGKLTLHLKRKLKKGRYALCSAHRRGRKEDDGAKDVEGLIRAFSVL